MPPQAELLEVEPLHFPEGPSPSVPGQRSLGEILEDGGAEAAGVAKTHRGKPSRLEPGMLIAYAKDQKLKVCTIGRVWSLTKADNPVQVHKYVSRWNDELRVHWVPLHVDSEGVETTQAAGGKPSLEGITRKQVLDIVQLNDGVLNHAMSRKLDRRGWKIPEKQFAEPGHTRAQNEQPRQRPRQRQRNTTQQQKQRRQPQSCGYHASVVRSPR